MSRRGRWIVAALLVVLVLPLLVVGGVLFLVDPNRLRPSVEQAVQRQYGLTLHLDGDLRWSWRPLLAVAAGAGALGAGAEPPLRWRQLQFGLRWRELFADRILIDSLHVEGLQLDLARLAELQPATPPGTNPLEVRALEVRDGSLRYGAWRGEGIDAQLAFHFDPVARTLDIAEPSATLRVHHPRLPAAGVRLSASAPALQLREGGAVLLPVALRLELAAAKIATELREPLRWSPLRAVARVQVDDASLRQTLGALGVAPPATRDTRTLGRVQASAELTVAEGSVSARGLNIAMDGTTLAGEASWRWPANANDAGAVRFNLRGDTLDLDRYLPPLPPAARARSTESSANAAAQAALAALQEQLPALRRLPLQGELRLQTLKTQGATARNARLVLE